MIMKYLTRLTALLCAILTPLGLFAQSAESPLGSLGGLIVDIENGVPLIGASVSVEGTEITGSTDLDGRFSVSGIPVGNVNVIFSRNGYMSTRVDNVVIVAEEPVSLELGLARATTRTQELSDEGVVELDLFVVEFEEVKTQNMALLLDRQASASVSDAIGSDYLSRLGLGDAAEAMTKVTGASIVDGKYVVIRGLGDRYSNTLLNGSTVPSADPDRRAVQMDQFPSDLLESIVTSKSFTPDQPGSFSGGSVNIKTKSFPEEFFVKLGGSMSYNTNTTKEEVLVTQQGVGLFANGKKDREIGDVAADGIPSLREVRAAASNGDLSAAQELDAITRAFPEGLYPLADSAPANYGLNVSFGDSIEFDDSRKLGYTFSFTSDNSYSHYTDGVETRYNGLSAEGLPTFSQDATGYSSETDFLVNNLNYYTDRYTLDANNQIDTTVVQPLDPYLNDIPFGVTETTHTVSWGAFGKVAYRFSDDHEIGLTLFHNQSAEDEVSRGIGFVNPGSGDGTDQFVEGISVLYTERGITSAQLNGEHFFSDLGDMKVEWQLSSTKSTQDQPDYRTFFWGWDYDEVGIWNSSNNLGGINRLFREMEETRDEFKLDITKPITTDLSLKFGGLYAESEREYRETGFNVSPRGGFENNPSNPFFTEEELVADQVGNVEDLFTEDTIGIDFDAVSDDGSGGFDLTDALEGRTVISQSTALENASNLYDGEGSTQAAYIMGDWKAMDKLRLIGGVRYEKNEMDVTQFFRQEGIDDRFGGFESEDFLPAFSAVYDLRDNMNLRFAYGRTIATPTFKEISPIEIENRFTGTTEQGNPNLTRTLIDNFDLRWEWFLENGQIIAVSAFYKSMEDPIEIVETAGVDLDGDGFNDLFAGNIVPQNVEEATIAGLEFEWRYQLGELIDSLRHFTLSGNLTVVDSEVSVPVDEQAIVDQAFLETERQLTGQSPYIVNFDISYDQPDWGTGVSLSYNYTDDRLFLVNPTKNGGLGNVFEEGRGSLNLNITQQINEGWSVKFSASNLLNPDYRYYYENLNGGSDVLYSLSDRGRTFGVSLSYTFK